MSRCEDCTGREKRTLTGCAAVLMLERVPELGLCPLVGGNLGVKLALEDLDHRACIRHCVEEGFYSKMVAEEHDVE